MQAGQAQQFVKRRRDISLTELDKAAMTLDEQMRAQEQQQRATGIQGGFANDQGIVLQQEKRTAAGDIEKEYQSEISVLNEIDREKKEQEDEAKKAAKWRNWLQGGGMVAGALLAPLTGGTSLAAIGMGAGLGAQAGQVASGLLGYDDLAAQDVSNLMQGLGQFDRYIKFRKTQPVGTD
jgi:hypothetical protein